MWNLLIGPVFQLLERVIPDKAQAEKAKLDLLAVAQTQEFQATLEQAKINQVEAGHRSIFVAGWRPFIGWVCGSSLAYHFMVYPLLTWIASVWRPGLHPPVLSSDNLFELTIAMLGMASMRSWEKFKGIAK